MNFWTRASIKLRLLTPKFFFGPRFSDFLLDHIKPYIYFDRWHIQPFNGQAQRMSTISKICRDFSPNMGIETGTYLGSSTPYLAAMVSEEMYTIEIDPSVAAQADERFKKNHPDSRIQLRIGDSVSEIVKVLEKIDPKSKRVIAYLDAHWYEAVPTTTEIEALINWGGSWIAIIDDFKVDIDPLYKFDVYGSIEIGPSILPPTSGISLFVTNQSALIETGRRKGTGYVCMLKDEQILANVPELVKVQRSF